MGRADCAWYVFVDGNIIPGTFCALAYFPWFMFVHYMGRACHILPGTFSFCVHSMGLRFVQVEYLVELRKTEAKKLAPANWMQV